MRLSNQPLALRKLQEYAVERYQRREEEVESFLYGKTLDNTIYRTEVIRRLGGFPKLSISAGVDNVLAQRIHSVGFKWKVDYTVKSTHLRKGLRDELAHYYWYGTCQKELAKQLYNGNVDLIHVALITAFSPIRSLQLAFKQGCWQITYIYPLIRLSMLRHFNGICLERREKVRSREQ